MVGLGDTLFGVLFGFVAAFTTRFTGKVREIEPLIIFLYLAYLIAELLAISSIMAHVRLLKAFLKKIKQELELFWIFLHVMLLFLKYGNLCLDYEVLRRGEYYDTTIRHVIKMVGSVSETLIFFFRAVVTIRTEREWNWGYSLLCCGEVWVWEIIKNSQITKRTFLIAGGCFFTVIGYNTKWQYYLYK